MTLSKMRLDKWLWCVRIYKSRTIAAEACRKGRVFSGDLELKPSAMIQTGTEIRVRKDRITYTFRVLSLPPARLSASLAQECYVNLTPQEELNRIKEIQESSFYRPATGRPTKKERRELEEFLEDL